MPLTNWPVDAGKIIAVGMTIASKPEDPTHGRDERRWAGLMKSAQSGNEADYRELLSELSNVIERFLARRFGNHAFVEDCVQEALMAIHQARHTYDPERPFRPWLFAIVKRKAIDTLRKQKTRQRHTDQFVEQQTALGRMSRQGEAESEVVKGQLLELLPEAHRSVLVMTKIAGYSVAETASELGISESLVKVRVHRAIQKLKKMIKVDTL